MRRGGGARQSRLTTRLGKTRQPCWKNVQKRRVPAKAGTSGHLARHCPRPPPSRGILSVERLHFLAPGAGEAKGIDVLFLELRDQPVGLTGVRKRSDRKSTRLNSSH